MSNDNSNKAVILRILFIFFCILIIIESLCVMLKENREFKPGKEGRTGCEI